MGNSLKDMFNRISSPAVRWVLATLLVLVVLSCAKDFLIKIAIESSAPKVIGSKLKLGEFSLGLLTQRIHIKDFELYNPPGFPNKVFLVIPEIDLQANPFELMKGNIHFSHVIFNMDKMIVYKNKEGRLNVESLKIVEEQIKASKEKSTPPPAFKIDSLKLNLGKVILEDETHAPPLMVLVYNVNVKDKVIKDVSNLPKLATVIVAEALKPTAIRSAGLMAATTVMGVAFLPAVAVGVIIADDDAKASLNYSSQRVYQESLNLIKELGGTIKKTEQSPGKIFAKVYGSDFFIEIQDKGWGKSSVLIKVRKFMLAKPEIAGGFLYQLTERLK